MPATALKNNESGEKVETWKLGELQVDRSVWVRDHIDTDFVNCLINALYNGAKFPPFKADRVTKKIIGGNHRFEAMRKYYGDGWELHEAKVIPKDMPPFESNPEAWYIEALKDNQGNNSLRLSKLDREFTGKKLINILRDSKSPEMKEVSRLLCMTVPQAFEFVRRITRNEVPVHSVPSDHSVGVKSKPIASNQNDATDDKTDNVVQLQDLSEVKSHRKHPSHVRDYGPADVPQNGKERTPRSELISAGKRFIYICNYIAKDLIEAITPAERRLLNEVKEALDRLG